MSYQSPIEVLFTDMKMQFDRQINGGIVNAVQAYKINVDAEELKKALDYDRDQYHRGFADGKNAAVIHAHWKEGFCRQACSNCGYRGCKSYLFCPICGAKMDEKEDER